MSKSYIEIIKNAKTYMGKRGYIIRKNSLNNEQLINIRNDLTITPFTLGDYGTNEEPFKIYLENKNKVYVPKFYGIEKFGNPDVNIIPKGKDINVEFSLKLKDEQQIPAQETLKSYYEKGGGILSLPCGFGKTILGLYFISKLQKKTIIIVHKEFLMNQWIERIKFAIPKANIGIIQGDKCEIENNDIIIAMLQTLSMKDFPEETFDDIGHVIIDECHRIPSKVFSKALLKINCNYMLGLSATPNRKDGLTKVLKYYIGDIIYSVKQDEKNVVLVNRYIIESLDEEYNKELVNFRGQVQMPTMINNISNCENRTKLIMNCVIDEIKKNEQRQILILSDRKQHLNDMYKIAIKNGISSIGYYIGGLKKDILKENENCKILLGTYPMANEGLDIPTLNGLVLSTPKSDIIQSIGRICRVKHFNIQPIIIDIVDKFSIFEIQSKKRMAIYKKKKYQVKDFFYNLEKNTIVIEKDYFYHNCLVNENSDSSDLEDIQNGSKIEVDTNYDNIDVLTNKKIKKNNVIIEKSRYLQKKDEENNFNNLFKSVSMFSEIK
jgi:superfamily II DNA or RNA helicase